MPFPLLTPNLLLCSLAELSGSAVVQTLERSVTWIIYGKQSSVKNGFLLEV